MEAYVYFTVYNNGGKETAKKVNYATIIVSCVLGIFSVYLYIYIYKKGVQPKSTHRRLFTFPYTLWHDVSVFRF